MDAVQDCHLAPRTAIALIAIGSDFLFKKIPINRKPGIDRVFLLAIPLTHREG